MTATYDCIATTTLGSTQTSVSLTSISGSYTDLIIIINGSFSSGSGVDTQFNSDTGTNYSRTRVYGDGTSALSARSTNATAISSGYLGTTQSVTIIQIMNYANTTTYKTLLARGSASGSQVVATAGLWRSTAAITSVTLSGGTFASGSTFTLYGIKAE